MKYRFIFIIMFVTLTACAGQATSTPANYSSLVLHFPQLISTPNSYLEALITGELVLDNGCLRVKEADGSSVLLIWRPGFSTRTENEVVQVTDSTVQVTASVGDLVEVGGGFTDNPTPLGLAEPLPKDCPGSYWLVGEWIRKIDTSSLGIHFPQLIRPQIPPTQTVTKGNLILENGCLRLNVADGGSFLLIWNRRFSTRTEQDVVRVVDSQTEDTLASTGDFADIVGGVIDDPIGWGMIAPIPSECSDPYLLVGGSIRKIDKP